MPSELIQGLQPGERCELCGQKKRDPVDTIRVANRIKASADRIEALEKALEPFARMGWLLDGPFDTALFRDDQAVGLGGAWRENGETRTITFGDLRLAATLLNKDTPNNV
jgi:hypothetical protein